MPGRARDIRREGLGVFSLGQGEAMDLRGRFAGVAKSSEAKERFMAGNAATRRCSLFNRVSHMTALIISTDYSFALAGPLISLARSRSTRRNSFPLGETGITSTNSTPPARCLYATLFSATRCGCSQPLTICIREIAILLS